MSDFILIVLILFMLVTIPVWAPFAWVVAVFIVGAIIMVFGVVIVAVVGACASLSNFCAKYLR